MSIRQNKISHISTVLRLAVITVFMFGLIVVASEDLGVALQYLFIFVIMAFVGGVSLLWFLGAGAVLLVASPFLWQFLSYDRRSRIWVLFDPRIDPLAQDQRYQMNRSLRALQNGGVTGQGLYHGTMVQSGSIPAQHTDLIFSSIGEELGMLGCMAVLILLTAIIIRIIHVGIKSGNYMNRLICVGIAGMLTAQVFINIGVCIGLVPVIGLTLPFFSYGGGSFFLFPCIFSRCAQKLPPNHLKGGFPFETPHPLFWRRRSRGAGACHALRARAGRGDRRGLHFGIPVQRR